MAVLHKSFQFDPQAINNIFNKCNTSDLNKFKSDLYYLASTSVKNYPDISNSILRFLRFDEDWLENDKDSYKLDKWFLLSFIQYFSPSADLSSTVPFSYRTLMKLLPILGWDSETINALVYGRGLNSLISRYANHPFSHEVDFFQYYGGWLDSNEINTLYQKTKSIKKFFHNPGIHLINQFKEIGEFDNNVLTIQKSYFELLQMMEEPIKSDRCLFLIFD